MQAPQQIVTNKYCGNTDLSLQYGLLCTAAPRPYRTQEHL